MDEWQLKTAALLQADPWRMACLNAVRALQLPDWYLAAGFLRNAIWDAAHECAQTPLNDIDLVFFDPLDVSLDRETRLEQQLHALFPGQRFEVRNQARMHLKHGHPPYQYCGDGIRRWVEKPTCVGVRLLENDQLVFFAPFGLALNWSLQLEINPDFPRPDVFAGRVSSKGWLQLWPQLQLNQAED
ncbi:MAG: nucleotidyltransferase family protein [Rheinheimera sp.]|nr:nucleotidyltransferase family protein [Rheinheimera sp.]